MRLRILVTAILATGVLLLPTSAQAKGATDVTVTGPGLAAPIRLGNASPDGTSANRLWQAAGLLVSNPDRISDNVPQKGALGPRYRATFHWLVGPDETTPIRQELYPFADSGALSFTPPGQKELDWAPRGGWYQAGPELTLLLADAGVPVPRSYTLPVPVVAPPQLTG
jgi:hypothetical protein